MKLVPFTALFIFDGVDVVGKLSATILASKSSTVFKFVVVYKEEVSNLITLFIGNLLIFCIRLLGEEGIFSLFSEPSRFYILFKCITHCFTFVGVRIYLLE